MNLYTEKESAKIPISEVVSETNNIIIHGSDTPSEAFKVVHYSLMQQSGIKQSGEGFALGGLDQSQVSKLLDPTEKKSNLQAWQVPSSKVRHGLLNYLANQACGHYTPPVTGLNGSWTDEFAGILKSGSEIAKHGEEKERVKAAFARIEKLARKAQEEMK